MCVQLDWGSTDSTCNTEGEDHSCDLPRGDMDEPWLFSFWVRNKASGLGLVIVMRWDRSAHISVQRTRVRVSSLLAGA